MFLSWPVDKISKTQDYYLLLSILTEKLSSIAGNTENKLVQKIICIAFFLARVHHVVLVKKGGNHGYEPINFFL